MSTAPRIYVACLAAYNNGILHGEWIDADQSADEIHEAVQRMLAASPEPGAEEWAIHGAPRGALSYPFHTKEELRGMFLGHPAHLEAKAEGDNSMSGKQWSVGGVQADVLQVSRDMAKAGLPETQSPAGVSAPPVGMTLETDAAPCSDKSWKLEHLRGAGRRPARVVKEMSGWPKSRSIRTTRTNAGSPTGREPYGDGVPVVVAGVTSCQGDRESRSQGKGAQVVTMSNEGKHA